MMDKEDFVTYEQAVKLKELGFNWECKEYYTNDYVNDDPEDLSKEVKFNYGYLYNQNIIVGRYSSPTLSQAAKWLREEKGLYINIWLCAAGYSWNIEKCGNLNCNGTFVTRHDEESGDDEDSGLFTTYEKALSSGIDKALNFIQHENRADN